MKLEGKTIAAVWFGDERVYLSFMDKTAVVFAARTGYDGGAELYEGELSADGPSSSHTDSILVHLGVIAAEEAEVRAQERARRESAQESVRRVARRRELAADPMVQQLIAEAVARGTV